MPRSVSRGREYYLQKCFMWTGVLLPEAFHVDRSIISGSVSCGPECDRSVVRGPEYDRRKRFMWTVVLFSAAFHVDRSMTSRSVYVDWSLSIDPRKGRPAECKKKIKKRSVRPKQPTDISIDRLSKGPVMRPSDPLSVRPTESPAGPIYILLPEAPRRKSG